MPQARTCQKCGGRGLKRRSTTYPFMLSGRQINVERVKVLECPHCGHLLPTPEGQAKLQRCLQAVGELLDKAQK